MQEGQNKLGVIEPEEVVVGLHQRGSFDYTVPIFHSVCHFGQYYLQFGSHNQHYLNPCRENCQNRELFKKTINLLISALLTVNGRNETHRYTFQPVQIQTRLRKSSLSVHHVCLPNPWIFKLYSPCTSTSRKITTKNHIKGLHCSMKIKPQNNNNHLFLYKTMALIDEKGRRFQYLMPTIILKSSSSDRCMYFWKLKEVPTDK